MFFAKKNKPKLKNIWTSIKEEKRRNVATDWSCAKNLTCSRKKKNVSAVFRNIVQVNSVHVFSTDLGGKKNSKKKADDEYLIYPKEKHDNKQKSDQKKHGKKRGGGWHWGSVSFGGGLENWLYTRLKRDEYFSPGGRTAFLFLSCYFAAKVTPVEAHSWQPVFRRDLHRFQEKVWSPERQRETAAHVRPYLDISSAFHHPPNTPPTQPATCSAITLEYLQRSPGRAREGHRRGITDFRNK